MRLSGLEDLNRKLRAREISSVQIAEIAVANYRESEGYLNAYKLFDDDACLRQAEMADAAFNNGVDLGPLQGIPVSVKDMFGVACWPTHAGARESLPEAFSTEGDLVRTLHRQLAVIVGKTHTVEYALGGLGVNSHFGTPRNPRDTGTHRVPGGSSSGAGVSLLQGSALLALGTDTAGSVRVPAAFTGTVGFKPSQNAWSTDGIVPLSQICDTPGLLARTAADLRFVIDSFPPLPSGRARPPLSGARFGIDRQFFFDRCDREIAEHIDRVIERLTQAGAKVINLSFSEAWEAEEIFRKGGIAAPELLASFGTVLPDRRSALDPSVRQRLQEAETMTAAEFIRRSRTIKVLAKSASDRMEGLDAILSPATLNLPPDLESLNDPVIYAEQNKRAMGNTAPFSLFGFCALVLPASRSASGLPIGLQLAAPAGAERSLISLACEIEELLGNADAILGQEATTG